MRARLADTAATCEPLTRVPPRAAPVPAQSLPLQSRRPGAARDRRAVDARAVGGDRRAKWIPHQAKLKILEGPRIPLSQLTMGRGWRAAERQGRDVTDLMLAAAKQAAAPPSPPAPSETAPPTPAPSTSLPTQPAQPDSALVADSLGLELLALLAGGPAPLSAAWRRAAERFPERTPSENLELAERAVRSLLAGPPDRAHRAACEGRRGPASLTRRAQRPAGRAGRAAAACARQLA